MKKEADIVGEELCREVLSQIDEALCLSDSKGNIVFSNDQFQKYFGACKGKTLKQICSSSNCRKSVACPAKIPDKKTVIEIELKMPPTALQVIHTPISIGKKRFFIDEFRDVTHTKKIETSLTEYTGDLEDEIKRRIEDLRMKVLASEDERAKLIDMMDDLNAAYGKLEEEAVRKDELFNITSHELKTPLVPLEGFTDLLLKSRNLKDEEKAYLETMRRNVLRLKRMLDNIIDIAKLQAHKGEFRLATAQIHHIVNGAVDSLKEHIKSSGIKLTKTLPSGIKVRCDSQKIGKAITHIIENAIKFNRPKGTVKISAKKKGKDVIITVTDTGRGIPPEMKDKIFEKFFQVDAALDREVGGAGIGLTVCRAIVDAHNGEIQVESTAGKGSTFRLILPIDLKAVKKKTDFYSSNVELLEKERKKLELDKIELMTQL